MRNKNIKNFLKLVSKKESGWLKKAKWRQDNQEWLDKSFKISISILRTIRYNRNNNIHPNSLDELAVFMGYDSELIYKYAKGEYKFDTETIKKLEKELLIILNYD